MGNKNDLPIIQVVGYKRSGKTTLIKKLISSILKDLSLNVATLKHHGHGGEPNIVKGTDSYEHLQAGALMSGVQGENRLQLKIAHSSHIDLEEIIAIYKHFPIDLLLIEGYKRAPYPKIVLLNDSADEHLLRLENIIAVGGWSRPTLLEKQYLTFSINDFEAYKQLFNKLVNNFLISD